MREFIETSILLIIIGLAVVLVLTFLGTVIGLILSLIYFFGWVVGFVIAALTGVSTIAGIPTASLAGIISICLVLGQSIVSPNLESYIKKKYGARIRNFIDKRNSKEDKQC